MHGIININQLIDKCYLSISYHFEQMIMNTDINFKNGPVGTFQRVMNMKPVFEPEAFALLLYFNARATLFCASRKPLFAQSTTELRAHKIFGFIY